MSIGALMKLYFQSVGRGCNLILNVPPDRRGRIPEDDARALFVWRKELDPLFSEDLARKAKSSSNSRRGDDGRFAPENVTDGDPTTYWASKVEVRAPELILELPRLTTFKVVRLREYLPLGQHVDRFALDSWNGQGWHEFASGTSVGNQRTMPTGSVTTTRVRLRIVEAQVCPAISELSLFASPKK
jgi:alpha-L-fucosidase